MRGRPDGHHTRVHHAADQIVAAHCVAGAKGDLVHEEPIALLLVLPLPILAVAALLMHLADGLGDLVRDEPAGALDRAAELRRRDTLVPFLQEEIPLAEGGVVLHQLAADVELAAHVHFEGEGAPDGAVEVDQGDGVGDVLVAGEADHVVCDGNAEQAVFVGLLYLREQTKEVLGVEFGADELSRDIDSASDIRSQEGGVHAFGLNRIVRGYKVFPNRFLQLVEFFQRKMGSFCR